MIVHRKHLIGAWHNKWQLLWKSSQALTLSLFQGPKTLLAWQISSLSLLLRKACRFPRKQKPSGGPEPQPHHSDETNPSFQTGINHTAVCLMDFDFHSPDGEGKGWCFGLSPCCQNIHQLLTAAAQPLRAAIRRKRLAATQPTQPEREDSAADYL